MSKGPGKIERIVECTLANTDRSFIVEELARIAYPGVPLIEKKHRVSVIRTFDNLDKRLKTLWYWRSEQPPWRLILSNLSSVRSWTHGYLRSWHYEGHERSLEEIDRILNDQSVQADMNPSGLLWVAAEIGKLECALRGFKAPPGKYIPEPPPEYQEMCDRVSKLRMCLCALTGHCSLSRHYFARFEPPESAIYQYAITHPLTLAHRSEPAPTLSTSD